MQSYIWIALIVFAGAVIAYLKSAKPKEEESDGDERNLIGMGGIYNGQIFPIGREVVIGRDIGRCGIIYPEGTRGISSVHCTVRVERDGRVALIDMGSTYGTFRDNGEKLSPGTVYYLGAGDGLYVGDTENTFLLK